VTKPVENIPDRAAWELTVADPRQYDQEQYVLGHRVGEQMLSGHLTPPMIKHELDIVDVPPARFNEVRLDIALATAPMRVDRVALQRSQHAYTGIIDSAGHPYMFVLSSKGLMLKAAPDEAAAWVTFDHLMEQERAAAREARRDAAAAEFAHVVPMDVVKAIKMPTTATAHPQSGHVAYYKTSKHGVISHVQAKGTPHVDPPKTERIAFLEGSEDTRESMRALQKTVDAASAVFDWHGANGDLKVELKGKISASSAYAQYNGGSKTISVRMRPLHRPQAPGEARRSRSPLAGAPRLHREAQEEPGLPPHDGDRARQQRQLLQHAH
jgi:hypothetical protein